MTCEEYRDWGARIRERPGTFIEMTRAERVAIRNHCRDCLECYRIERAEAEEAIKRIRETFGDKAELALAYVAQAARQTLRNDLQDSELQEPSNVPDDAHAQAGRLSRP